MAGAELIRRHIGVPYRFGRAEDVMKFVGLAALTATIAPTVALLPLGLMHPMPGVELFRNWLTWWQGDATGIVLITPLILSWAAPGRVRWARALRAVCEEIMLELMYKLPDAQQGVKYIIDEEVVAGKRHPHAGMGGPAPPDSARCRARAGGTKTSRS